VIELAPLFVAVPLGAAFLCLLGKAFPRIASTITVASAAFVLALSLLAVWGRDEGVVFAGSWAVITRGGESYVAGIALVLDGLSRLFLLMTAVVSAAVVVYGLRYTQPYTARPLYHPGR